MALIKVPEVKLRIMSLNTQYCAGSKDDEGDFMKKKDKKELDHNKQKIAELIAEINPDIVCMQEVDKCSNRSHFEDQGEDIRRRVARITNQDRYNYEFGSCIDLDQKKMQELLDRYKLGFLVPAIRKYYEDKKYAWIFEKADVELGMLSPGEVKLHFGNAILTRPGLPIKEVKHEFFFRPSAILIMYLNIIRRKDERKSYLRCKIDYFPKVAEKIPLYVINTHFENNDPKKRIEQTNILYEKLHKRSGAHKILCGDFNDKGEGVLEKIISHPNIKCYPGLLDDMKKFATYPTWKAPPDEVFDAILASQFLEIDSYEVLTDDRYKVSDHYAVVADIRINHDLVPRNILKQMLTKSEQKQ
ncbi:MAG: hypothetical protein KKA62_06095 [Nanoarchaeota archaeon]|nr:hypothetical protein [Nanoarchaeota archaeon]MBU1644420.1 hypothetical protein [Nanoarchaeota archaeon]MBU1977496.1 hypothetical protein [Nanoarchaeota archaeon]